MNPSRTNGFSRRNGVNLRVWCRFKLFGSFVFFFLDENAVKRWGNASIHTRCGFWSFPLIFSNSFELGLGFWIRTARIGYGFTRFWTCDDFNKVKWVWEFTWALVGDLSRNLRKTLNLDLVSLISWLEFGNRPVILFLFSSLVQNPWVLSLFFSIPILWSYLGFVASSDEFNAWIAERITQWWRFLLESLRVHTNSMILACIWFLETVRVCEIALCSSILWVCYDFDPTESERESFFLFVMWRVLYGFLWHSRPYIGWHVDSEPIATWHLDFDCLRGLWTDFNSKDLSAKNKTKRTNLQF